MYLNLFKRQWCTTYLIQAFDKIKTDYEIYALNLQHDKITSPTFHERFITAIIVKSGDSHITYPVNHKLTYNDNISFSECLAKFMKTHPVTKKDIPLQQEMVKEVESSLGIDNNVNHDKENKITFCLNMYTPAEREKIIAFLMNVDEHSPEVIIDINMTTCTKEQAAYLSNLMICSTATVES